MSSGNRLKQSEVKRAYAGKSPALHRLILDAGYHDIRSLSAREAGEAFGVSAQAVAMWHSRDGCPRNADKTYDLCKLVAWRVERESERKSKKLMMLSDDPLLAGGGGSKALERYRLAKALEAERINNVAEGRQLDASDIRRRLMDIARIFRAEAESLERVHGKNVGDDLREMIDRVEQQFTERTLNGNHG